MPTYHVAVSLTRPPSLTDAELVDVLREAARGAMCEVIEVATAGLVIDCEPAALDLLETALRTKLVARGGALTRMAANRL